MAQVAAVEVSGDKRDRSAAGFSATLRECFTTASAPAHGINHLLNGIRLASLGLSGGPVTFRLSRMVSGKRVTFALSGELTAEELPEVTTAIGGERFGSIVFDLKEHGQHVPVHVTPLRRFEDFATDVKKRLG